MTSNYDGSTIISPFAPRRPSVKEDPYLVAQAAAQGRQTRDVPLIPGRRIVPSIAMSLGYYRDIRPDDIGLETYDQLRRDDTVAAALKLLKAPIIGRIKQATVQCDDPAIKRVIEYLFLESGLLTRLATSSFRALDFGVAFHEIEWEATELDLTYTDSEPGQDDVELPAWNGPGLWPKAFHEVNPATIREIRRDPVDHSYNGFTQRIWPEATVEAVNSFVYTHAGEFGNMWGWPQTRDAYPLWVWKQATIKSWMMWVEAKADPAKKSYFPRGQDPEGRDNAEIALDAALSLAGQSAVAIPTELQAGTDGRLSTIRSWDIEELQTTDQTDVFDKTVAFFNSAMLRAMFVPERTFTATKDTGTYAEAKAHTDTFMLTMDSLQQDFTESCNHYGVARVVNLNWGPAAAKATIVMPGITDEERDFARDAFQKLIMAPDPTMGGVIDVRAIAEAEGLPTTDADVAPPAQPTVGPPIADTNPGVLDPTGDSGYAPQLSAADAGRTTMPLDDKVIERISAQGKRLGERFLQKGGPHGAHEPAAASA